MCKRPDAAPAAAYIVPDARSSATLRQDEHANVLLALPDAQHGSPSPTPKLGAGGSGDDPTSDFALPERTTSPEASMSKPFGAGVRWDATAALGEQAPAPYPDAVPSSPGSQRAASARQPVENPVGGRVASPALQQSDTEAHKLFDEEAIDSPKLAPSTTRGRSTSGSRRARSHRSSRKELHALGGLSGDSDTDVYERRDAAQSRKAAARMSHG